jgi:hypothetical protein
VPLELGGSPAARANLWPEKGNSPNPKDRVEDAAKQALCARRMSLAMTQHAIASNWIALGQQLGVTRVPKPTPIPTLRPTPAPTPVPRPSLGPVYVPPATPLRHQPVRVRATRSIMRAIATSPANIAGSLT